MSLLRIAFWVVLLALLLPLVSPAEPQLFSSAASGNMESVLDSSQAEQFVIRTMRKVTQMCADYPTVCEIRDSAIHVLHTKAVDVTGALHNWLKAGLEEQEEA